MDYSVTHGYVNFTGKSTLFNASVPITCEVGYEPSGDQNITCLQDGTWTEITCVNKGKLNLN